MRPLRLTAGPWEAEVLPGDGARISMLRYDGTGLLTEAPPSFRPPVSDYGLYESRPVYGYDDCFPSVDACSYPEAGWDVPDHGELCWLPWECGASGDIVSCRVRSRALPLEFERRMSFSGRALDWEFRVRNEGGRPLPFQHVMHALMPVRSVRSLSLPSFSGMTAERGDPGGAGTPRELAERLLQWPERSAAMLYLHNASPGEFALGFEGGIGLTVRYPSDIFTTLGIWWNNGGYPDEEGCRRFECALEPIAGSVGRLDTAFAEGAVQMAAPGETVAWRVRWEVEAVPAS